MLRAVRSTRMSRLATRVPLGFLRVEVRRDDSLPALAKQRRKNHENPLDSPRGLVYSPSTEGREAQSARIAQLVEQRIENPRVGGSNPPPGTTKNP